MSERKPPYVPPDFQAGRTLTLERRINQAFAATFRADNPAALLCLDYLESAFVNRVIGPAGTDAQLRHHEGQRDLVRIIRQRIAEGRENLPKEPQEGAQ